MDKTRPYVDCKLGADLLCPIDSLPGNSCAPIVVCVGSLLLEVAAVPSNRDQLTLTASASESNPTADASTLDTR